MKGTDLYERQKRMENLAHRASELYFDVLDAQSEIALADSNLSANCCPMPMPTILLFWEMD